MNQNSSSNPSTSSSSRASAEAISRRAYELWEQEGRPDGNDLRHWLQAEQEMGGQTAQEKSPGYTDTPQARSTASDSRPLQGTRTSPPANNRDQKRSSNAPFAAEKSANGGTATAVGTRRRN